MINLNITQRVTIVSASLFLILLFLFPPWVLSHLDGTTTTGFYFVFSIHYDAVLDSTLLIILAMAIILVGFLLVIAFSSTPQWTIHPEVGRSESKDSSDDESTALIQQNTSNAAKKQKTLSRMIRERAIGYVSSNQLTDALFLLQRSLRNWPGDTTVADGNYLGLLHLLGNLYAHGGRADEAEDVYQRILEICEFTLGPDHPGTIQALEDYCALLERMNRKETAELYREMIRGLQIRMQEDDDLKPSEFRERVDKLKEQTLPPLPLEVEVYFDPEKQLSTRVPLRLGQIFPEELSNEKDGDDS